MFPNSLIISECGFSKEVLGSNPTYFSTSHAIAVSKRSPQPADMSNHFNFFVLLDGDNSCNIDLHTVSLNNVVSFISLKINSLIL